MFRSIIYFWGIFVVDFLFFPETMKRIDSFSQCRILNYLFYPPVVLTVFFRNRNFGGFGKSNTTLTRRLGECNDQQPILGTDYVDARPSWVWRCCTVLSLRGWLQLPPFAPKRRYSSTQSTPLWALPVFLNRGACYTP